MIGDSVESDIKGAKQAINATTLALKSEVGAHVTDPSIDMVFESFRDLEQWIFDKGWGDAKNIYRT